MRFKLTWFRQAAIEGLKTVMSPAVNPTGFKIGSTTVGVTFAHSDSFRLDYASSSWSIKDLETGRDIVYWDNKAFLEVFELPAARQLLEQRERHKSSQSQEPDPDEAFFASLEQDLDGGGQQQSKDIEAPLKQQPVTVPSVSLKSIALPTKKTEASTSTSQSK